MRYEDLPPVLNLAEYFLDRHSPDRTALITPAGPVSYGELAALSRRVGAALRRVGTAPGDRVLLMLRDSLEFVATWYGAQRIGAVTAEVPTSLSAAELRHYLDYVAPAAVVGDLSSLAAVRGAGADNALLTGLPQSRLRAGESAFWPLVQAQSDELAPIRRGHGEPAIWKFTTGSTGTPKACVLPLRSPVLSTHWYAQEVLGLTGDDLVLAVPKLFFGYARDLAALFPFGCGASGMVFPERSTPERLFSLIARHRPTVLVNVPTMMRAMVDHPERAGCDMSSLRLCVSAGEALPPELHRRWLDTFGVEVVDGIGSSEVYHIYASNRPGAARIGSLGRAVPGYRLRLLDGGGEPVEAGAVGRLEIEGETVALGYHGAPGASAEAFPAPHTHRSGDLFRQDEEGYLYYQGRVDDMLKVSGRWVAPIEIERCLSAHPKVADCAVVGHQVRGLLRPCAFVVARTPVTVAELKEFCRAHLARYKWPYAIRFLDTLPRTPTGKLDRRRLPGAQTESFVDPARVEN